MSHASSADLSRFLVFLFFIALIFVAGYLVNKYEKHKIQESAEEKGWTILKISSSWFHESRRGGPHYYDVEYKDRKGNKRRHTCKTSLFGGVDWHA